VFRPSLIPLGLTFGAMTGSYIAAVQITTAANAIYLQYTAIFWVIPLGILFLGERPDRRAVAAVAMAMCGIGLIVAWGYDGRPREWIGILLSIASGLGFAVIATGMRGLRDLDPVWLSAMYNLLGAVFLGVYCLLTPQGIATPSMAQTLVLLGYGVIQMALPYVLFARGLQGIGTAEASLLALIEPILSPIWVYLAIGERPAVATIVGGLFLLAGVACRYWPFLTPGKERDKLSPQSVSPMASDASRPIAQELNQTTSP
jgi:drug/metabolite transporter (DMT)-like permease